MKNIQSLLASYLKENRITIYQVAKRSGIKYELLRRSVNGTRVLTANELVAILESANISIDDILGR